MPRSSNLDIGNGLESSTNNRNIMSTDADRLQPSTQPSYTRQSDMNGRIDRVYSEKNSGRRLAHDGSLDSVDKN